jgi:hypothetical protein
MSPTGHPFLAKVGFHYRKETLEGPIFSIYRPTKEACAGITPAWDVCAAMMIKFK